MRTTITLDPDVAALVDKATRAGEQTFKQVVNDALRRGLTTGRAAQPFRTQTHDLGGARVDLTKALQLAGELEVEELQHKGRLAK